MKRRIMLMVLGLLVVGVLPTTGASAQDGTGGDEPDDRIVGGTVADPGEYPYQVALISDPSKPFRSQYCGGSIIHPLWILTAGHCAIGSDPADVFVLAGANTLAPGEGEVLPVRSIYVHPDYDEDAVAVRNDFALLRLERPVNSSLVAVVRPSQTGLYPPGTPAVVTGWGSLKDEPEFPGDYPHALREVTVPMVSDASCGSGASYGSAFQASNMICAGIAGLDSCFGDSGGPLTIDAPSGKIIQNGVVSWGDGCAKPNKPGVYSRVSAFFGWIQGIVGKPVNDAFGASTLVPCAVATSTGSNAFATREAGEPNHAANGGGGSQWWRFTAPTAGTLHLNTFGSDFDTLLGVYTGSTVDDLTWVAWNDNTNSDPRSSLETPVTAGQTVHIAVDGFNAADGGGATRGRVRLNVGFEPAAGAQFDDVSVGHPFFEDIEFIATRGITTGFADCTFHPGSTVTRGSMAAFFYRLSGWPQGYFPNPDFDDVGGGHAFYPEIAWMATEGITTGFPDGGFHPEESVTRQSMAAFFYRLAGSPAAPSCTTPPFSDVAIDAPFCKEIQWLAATGIAGGYSDGSFHPGEAVTRQAMARFMHNFLNA
jgi:secreted trypsin-like serine protease